jgi:sulfatase modifying factor 1
MVKMKQQSVQAHVNTSDGMTLVWIPSGTFMMGAPENDELAARNEKPQVNVELSKGFWMTATVVTQQSFAAVMGVDKIRSTFCGDDYPVTDISLTEVFTYCDNVGGRLPSEAEWEWAARGGGVMNRPFKPRDVSWFNKNSKGELHPVAKKMPNEFGLYDMLGNVCELTSTPWSFELVGGKDPGHGDRNIEIQRVIRSGSFANAENMVSATSRSVYLSQNKVPEKPFQVQNTCGFRYVMDDL